jgi:hypothetical protein
MNKKKYEKPSTRVIELQQRTMLLAGSGPLNTEGAQIDDYEEVPFTW